MEKPWVPSAPHFTLGFSVWEGSSSATEQHQPGLSDFASGTALSLGFLTGLVPTARQRHLQGKKGSTCREEETGSGWLAPMDSLSDLGAQGLFSTSVPPSSWGCALNF